MHHLFLKALWGIVVLIFSLLIIVGVVVMLDMSVGLLGTFNNDVPPGPITDETDAIVHTHDDSTDTATMPHEASHDEDMPAIHTAPAPYTGAYGSAVITTDGTYRYITSDGIPDHLTGTFPNPGNPNAISEQRHEYRVALHPSYTNKVTTLPIPGVALNGIPLEPGTAERYQNTSWAIEAFGADGTAGLGIDWSNAHVQPNGTYHYHAVPEGLLENALVDQTGDLIQLAWAADGFPIYYSQSNAYSSSWQLKSGIRPDGPGGAYDGTYTQDFEYVAGSGDLDECNGVFVGDEYVYIITDSFPYIQRCVHGTPDSTSFTHADTSKILLPDTSALPQNGPGQEGGTPPQAAVTACAAKSVGADCSFAAPQGMISGVCQDTPEGFACVPPLNPQ